MYVEYLTSAYGTQRPYPLVLIHGNAMTGTMIVLVCCMKIKRLISKGETADFKDPKSMKIQWKILKILKIPKIFKIP
jgi:hypothetical protein